MVPKRFASFIACPGTSRRPARLLARPVRYGLAPFPPQCSGAFGVWPFERRRRRYAKVIGSAAGVLPPG